MSKGNKIFFIVRENIRNTCVKQHVNTCAARMLEVKMIYCNLKDPGDPASGHGPGFIVLSTAFEGSFLSVERQAGEHRRESKIGSGPSLARPGRPMQRMRSILHIAALCIAVHGRTKTRQHRVKQRNTNPFSRIILFSILRTMDSIWKTTCRNLRRP